MLVRDTKGITRCRVTKLPAKVKCPTCSVIEQYEIKGILHHKIKVASRFSYKFSQTNQFLYLYQSFLREKGTNGDRILALIAEPLTEVPDLLPIQQ